MSNLIKLICASGTNTCDTLSYGERPIGRISKNDIRYEILNKVPLIQHGQVSLFVKSIFKRKRWFDKYIQFGGFQGLQNDVYKLNVNASSEDVSCTHIVSNTVVKHKVLVNEPYLGNVVIYELDYDDKYIQLTEEESMHLLL